MHNLCFKRKRRSRPDFSSWRKHLISHWLGINSVYPILILLIFIFLLVYCGGHSLIILLMKLFCRRNLIYAKKSIIMRQQENYLFATSVIWGRYLLSFCHKWSCGRSMLSCDPNLLWCERNLFPGILRSQRKVLQQEYNYLLVATYFFV